MSQNLPKPYGKRILIKPEQQATVIQTSDQNLIERAEVLAVGDSVLKIRPGDRLIFTSFGVDSVDLNGERHYFIIEDDSFILAIEQKKKGFGGGLDHITDH